MNPRPFSQLSVRRIVFLLLSISLGALYRLDFLRANSLAIDSDEAIVGLMAKHILEGRPVPIFYYGQHYMGSLEALVVAGLGWVFGLSVLTLKLAPLIFSLLLIWSVAEIAEELGGEIAAVAAGLMVALPPMGLLDWSTKARGGFIEIVYIGSLVVLLCLRALREDFPYHRTLAIGLLCGMGWWVNNQIIFFFPSIFFLFFFALLPKGKKTLGEHFLLALLGLLAGAFPALLYNYQQPFATSGIFHFATLSEVAAHARGFFMISLPILFGAKRFWQLEDIFPGASLLFDLAYVSIISLALLSHLPRFSPLQERFAKLFFVLFLIVVPSVFSLSTFGYLFDAPRYLLPLYIAFFALLGLGVAQLAKYSPGVALTSLAFFLVLNFASAFVGGRYLPGEPLVMGDGRVAKDDRVVAEWLLAHHIPWIRTNYWIGYRLAFETLEQVRFLVHGTPHSIRLPEYEELSNAREIRWSLPILTVPKQAVKEARVLSLLGFHFREERVGPYVLLSDIAPEKSLSEEFQIPSEELHVVPSLHQELAQNIIDHSWKTRWATVGPQRKNTEVKIEFSHPYQVNGIHSIIGEWVSDWPRGLEITIEGPDGQTTDLGLARKYSELQQLMAEEPDVWLWFPPRLAKRIIFRQIGESQVFDWSIAEIEVFAPKTSEKDGTSS